MAETWSPEEVMDFEQRYQRGELTPRQREIWGKWRAQYFPELPAAPLADVPKLDAPPIPPPAKPPDTRSWWERALERQSESGTLVVPGTEYPAAVPAVPTPGERTDLEENLNAQARRAAAESVSLGAPLLAPWSAPAVGASAPG